MDAFAPRENPFTRTSQPTSTMTNRHSPWTPRVLSLHPTDAPSVHGHGRAGAAAASNGLPSPGSHDTPRRRRLLPALLALQLAAGGLAGGWQDTARAETLPEAVDIALKLHPAVLGARRNAEAIRQIAAALQTQGGADAVNLKIAEQYVAAFNNLAKESNTLIMPANVADIGSLISAGMKILDKGKTSQ